MNCAVNPLCKHYTSYIENNAILRVKKIKISKITKFSTAIVLGKAMLTDTTQSLLRYTQTFWVEYSVHPAHVSVMNIVDDMRRLEFLAAKTIASSLRFIKVDMMTMKHKGVLRLLLNSIGDM